MPESGIPAGFRASWQQRGQLAVAKLGDKLPPDLKTEAIPGLLIDRREGPDGPDFIEVHIHGPLHRQGVARAIVPAAKSDEDRVFEAEIRRLHPSVIIEEEVA